MWNGECVRRIILVLMIKQEQYTAPCPGWKRKAPDGDSGIFARRNGATKGSYRFGDGKKALWRRACSGQPDEAEKWKIQN